MARLWCLSISIRRVVMTKPKRGPARPGALTAAMTAGSKEGGLRPPPLAILRARSLNSGPLFGLWLSATSAVMTNGGRRSRDRITAFPVKRFHLRLLELAPWKLFGPPAIVHALG